MSNTSKNNYFYLLLSFVAAQRGGPMVSRSGSAAGYSAWLGRLPAQGLSLAVMCNSDEASATALARRVGDQFLPAAPAAHSARRLGLEFPLSLRNFHS